MVVLQSTRLLLVRRAVGCICNVNSGPSPLTPQPANRDNCYLWNTKEYTCDGGLMRMRSVTSSYLVIGEHENRLLTAQSFYLTSIRTI